MSYLVHIPDFAFIPIAMTSLNQPKRVNPSKSL